MIRTVAIFISDCYQCPFLGYSQTTTFENQCVCTLLKLHTVNSDYVSEKKELDKWFKKECKLEEI